MNYPSKRAMIQQILEKHGYFDWYIAQPDTQNPDSRNPGCILINFVEKKRAELVIPYEWFQRYHRIAKLIALAVQHPSPGIFTGPVIFKEQNLARYRQCHE
jgi:hypothetical protein